MFKSLLDKKRPNVILLHGWGTTWESLYPLLQLLKNDFNLYAPNLPYPTSQTLTLSDYCQFVLNLIKVEKISHPIIVGHSLGGAIATQIAIDHPQVIDKIILLSAASIRHQIPKKWLFFQKFSPLLRPFRSLALKIARLDASDYIALKTNIEKATFRNLIHHDQTNSLPKITTPALILWGEQDTSTPLGDGQKIHSLIRNSQFKSYPQTGHFFYLDHPRDVSRDIINFINR